jgi:hypothetical protein
MYLIKSSLVGFITLILIIIELTIGFGTLAIVNVPRAIFPVKSLKIKLAKISNSIGEYTVYGLKIIMKIMHRVFMQVFDNN